MCPLVVESSISSSPLLLAVNDRQSQSHQLDSTSSTGNHVPFSLHRRTLHAYTHNIYTCTYSICLDGVMARQPSEEISSEMSAMGVKNTLNI